MTTESNRANIGEIYTENYSPVSLDTERGRIDTRYYHWGNEKKAVIYVGGIGGGFDTPAKGLYPRLCQEFLSSGISGLRIKFRNPIDLAESVFDVLNGIAFLSRDHIKAIGLVGHSFGGAVVIQAGARSNKVKTLVTLSSQSYGAEEAANLGDKSILLIHGSSDEVILPDSSIYIHQIARSPKRLQIIKNAHHVLDEKAEEVYILVRDWLTGHLGS
jgi:pimeloyl-ACP methyl ester carboxylesterase